MHGQPWLPGHQSIGGGISIEEPGSPGPGAGVTKTNVGAGVGPPGTAAEPAGAGDGGALDAGLAPEAAGDADAGGADPAEGNTPDALGWADGAGDVWQLAISVPNTKNATIAARRTKAIPTLLRRLVESMSSRVYETRPAG
jgi:hypothetical protein